MATHINGVGMTKFGRFPDRGLSDLGGEAVDEALADAGVSKEDLDLAVVGNSAAGVITGQTGVRGQATLVDHEIGGIPIINTENACATGSTALHQAHLHVSAGAADVALALGVEKLYLENDRERTNKAYRGAMGGSVDVGDDDDEEGSGGPVTLDSYAGGANSYLEETECTEWHLAEVAAKNHQNASMNPKAQYQEPFTVEDVLESRMIVPPLTLYMCSPVGDGAAAAIVSREETDNSVEIRASTLKSGSAREGEPGATDRAIQAAYDEGDTAPGDVDVAEVHDGASMGEISAYESLGFCEKGEGWKLVEDGETRLDGRIPVNTSGGLVSRGHPIGASGLAQVYELVLQLRGDAGDRQVDDVELALAQNHGGSNGIDAGASSVHILE